MSRPQGGGERKGRKRAKSYEATYLPIWRVLSGRRSKCVGSRKKRHDAFLLPYRDHTFVLFLLAARDPFPYPRSRPAARNTCFLCRRPKEERHCFQPPLLFGAISLGGRAKKKKSIPSRVGLFEKTIGQFLLDAGGFTL